MLIFFLKLINMSGKSKIDEISNHDDDDKDNLMYIF